MKRVFLLIAAFIILLSCASAVQVDAGVQFNTTDTGSSYYVATGFNATNLTVYPTAWNINGGNITTYSNVNMSMESLTDPSFLNFTNNATIANLTVDNNFANFTIIDDTIYGIYYQSNDTMYQEVTSNPYIYFTSVPAGSWYIPQQIPDSSFTVSLPIGELGLNFTAITINDVYLEPSGQAAGASFFTVTNTGTMVQSFRFYFNDTVPNIYTYASLSSDLSSPVEITTTTTTVIITNLAASGSDDVWMYVNLTVPSPGTYYKELTLNSS